jgi:hypothetical protein
VKRGRRNMIEWVVQRVDPQAACQEGQLEHDLRLSKRKPKQKHSHIPHPSPRRWPPRPLEMAPTDRVRPAHLLRPS